MTEIFCRQASQFVKIEDGECPLKDTCPDSEFTYCPKSILVGKE